MPLPKTFDENEWLVIISLVIAYSILLLLPKRFPTSISLLIMLFSIVTARLCDHLLASPDVDYYNINDTGKYDLFDLFTYVVYGPFGYFYIYFYEKLHIRKYKIPLYILIWSVIAIVVEAVFAYFNVFHYKGWRLAYSFCVYLVVQSFTTLFYNYIKQKHKWYRTE